MIGERSSEDLSSSGEGSTHIPRQTHTRQENACQMNEMSPDKAFSSAMGEGKAGLGGERCWNGGGDLLYSFFSIPFKLEEDAVEEADKLFGKFSRLSRLKTGNKPPHGASSMSGHILWLYGGLLKECTGELKHVILNRGNWEKEDDIAGSLS